MPYDLSKYNTGIPVQGPRFEPQEFPDPDAEGLDDEQMQAAIRERDAQFGPPVPPEGTEAPPGFFGRAGHMLTAPPKGAVVLRMIKQADLDPEGRWTPGMEFEGVPSDQIPKVTNKELIAGANKFLGQELEKEYNKLQRQRQPTTSEKWLGVGGDIVGGLGAAVGSNFLMPGLGMPAAFGAQSAYDSFIKAGVQALSEGKDLEGAVETAKVAAIAGIPGGAALGALRSPKALAGTIKGTALVGGAGGLIMGGTRRVQNEMEQSLGLQTENWQDVPESTAFGVGLPFLAHGVFKGLGVLKQGLTPLGQRRPVSESRPFVEGIGEVEIISDAHDGMGKTVRPVGGGPEVTVVNQAVRQVSKLADSKSPKTLVEALLDPSEQAALKEGIADTAKRGVPVDVVYDYLRPGDEGYVPNRSAYVDANGKTRVNLWELRDWLDGRKASIDKNGLVTDGGSRGVPGWAKRSAIKAVINEEGIHHLALKIARAIGVDFATMWQDLPRDIQDQVNLSYTGYKEGLPHRFSDSQMGQEYFRMVMQREMGLPTRERAEAPYFARLFTKFPKLAEMAAERRTVDSRRKNVNDLVDAMNRHRAELKKAKETAGGAKPAGEGPAEAYKKPTTREVLEEHNFRRLRNTKYWRFGNNAFFMIIHDPAEGMFPQMAKDIPFRVMRYAPNPALDMTTQMGQIRRYFTGVKELAEQTGRPAQILVSQPKSTPMEPPGISVGIKPNILEEPAAPGLPQPLTMPHRFLGQVDQFAKSGTDLPRNALLEQLGFEDTGKRVRSGTMGLTRIFEYKPQTDVFSAEAYTKPSEVLKSKNFKFKELPTGQRVWVYKDNLARVTVDLGEPDGSLIKLISIQHLSGSDYERMVAKEKAIKNLMETADKSGQTLLTPMLLHHEDGPLYDRMGFEQKGQPHQGTWYEYTPWNAPQAHKKAWKGLQEGGYNKGDFPDNVTGIMRKLWRLVDAPYLSMFVDDGGVDKPIELVDFNMNHHPQIADEAFQRFLGRVEQLKQISRDSERPIEVTTPIADIATQILDEQQFNAPTGQEQQVSSVMLQLWDSLPEDVRNMDGLGMLFKQLGFEDTGTMNPAKSGQDQGGRIWRWSPPEEGSIAEAYKKAPEVLKKLKFKQDKEIEGHWLYPLDTKANLGIGVEPDMLNVFVNFKHAEGVMPLLKQLGKETGKTLWLTVDLPGESYAIPLLEKHGFKKTAEYSMEAVGEPGAAQTWEREPNAVDPPPPPMPSSGPDYFAEAFKKPAMDDLKARSEEGKLTDKDWQRINALRVAVEKTEADNPNLKGTDAAITQTIDRLGKAADTSRDAAAATVGGIRMAPQTLPGSPETLSGGQLGRGGGLQSLQPIEPAESFTKAILTPGRVYSEHMTDTLYRIGGRVSKRAAQTFNRIIARQRDYLGILRPALEPALREAQLLRGDPVMDITTAGPLRRQRAGIWMNKIIPTQGDPLTGTRRSVEVLQNQNATVPAYAQRLVQLARTANQARAVLQGIPGAPGIPAPLWEPNITSLGHDVIRRGAGQLWENWTLGLSIANNVPLTEVTSFFRRMKAAMSLRSGQGGPAMARLIQEFSQRFPNQITDVRGGGVGWEPVLHAELFSYLNNSAERAAYNRAFRDRFPVNAQGQSPILRDLTRAIREETPGQYHGDLDALLRALHGYPTDSYTAPYVSSDTVLGRGSRLLNQTVGNLFARVILTGQAMIQSGESLMGGTPMFLGYPNYLRGLLRMGKDALTGQIDTMAATSPMIRNWILDPNSFSGWVRSLTRNMGNLLDSTFQSSLANEIQEKWARFTAEAVASRIEAQTLSKWERKRLPATFREMGFTRNQAARMIANRDPALVREFVQKAASLLTSGNKHIAEGSLLGGHRLFNSIFRFQSYPMMKWNQTRKVWHNLARAKNTGERVDGVRQIVRQLGFNVGQGAITSGFTAMLSAGLFGWNMYKKESRANIVKFIVESYLSALGGPLYLLWRGARYGHGVKGTVAGVTETAGRMIFPWTMMQALYDATLGDGAYKDLDEGDRWRKFVQERVPGLRVFGTGVSIWGLGSKDAKLDAALRGLYRWRRDNFKTDPSEQGRGGPDNEFRKYMRQAVEAMQNGRREEYQTALENAGTAHMEKAMEKGTPSQRAASIRASLLARRVLIDPENKRPLTWQQKEHLVSVIGQEAFDRVQGYDYMLESAANGALLEPETDKSSRQRPTEPVGEKILRFLGQ